MRKVLVISLVAVLLCTGCGSSITLTNEQNDVIAEYAAGVLLKYTYDNEWKYEKLKQKQSIYVSSGERATSGVNSSNSSNKATGASGTANNGAGTTTDVFTSLASALGLTGATITYSDYEVGDSYPTGELVLNVPADTGKKIVAVELEIKNNSSSAITANTSSLGLSMKLTVNGSAAVTESMTILKNDISNMKNVNIAAGESYIAIALFQVPESNAGNITSMSAAVSVNGKSLGSIKCK